MSTSTTITPTSPVPGPRAEPPAPALYLGMLSDRHARDVLTISVPAAPACGKCNTTTGYIRKGTQVHVRYNGARYGFAARLCHYCLTEEATAVRLRRVNMPTLAAGLDGGGVAPCGKCGDPGGMVRKGTEFPMRYNGRNFGYNEKLCHDCFHPLHRAWVAASADDKDLTPPGIERARLAICSAHFRPGDEAEAARLHHDCEVTRVGGVAIGTPSEAAARELAAWSRMFGKGWRQDATARLRGGGHCHLAAPAAPAAGPDVKQGEPSH